MNNLQEDEIKSYLLRLLKDLKDKLLKALACENRYAISENAPVRLLIDMEMKEIDSLYRSWDKLSYIQKCLGLLFYIFDECGMSRVKKNILKGLQNEHCFILQYDIYYAYSDIVKYILECDNGIINRSKFESFSKRFLEPLNQERGDIKARCKIDIYGEETENEVQWLIYDDIVEILQNVGVTQIP